MPIELRPIGHLIPCPGVGLPARCLEKGTDFWVGDCPACGAAVLTYLDGEYRVCDGHSTHQKAWRATCDGCGFESRAKCKDEQTPPKGWTGNGVYCLCAQCTWESEQDAAAADMRE